MNGAEQALATLRDYIERSTHWEEGGADRHAALKEALPAIEGVIKGATLELTAALEYVDRVRSRQRTEISYETFQRAGFKRKEGWFRKYTLSDARKDADNAAIRLRNAWEILDPIAKL